MQTQTNSLQSLDVSSWLPLAYSDLERVDNISTPVELCTEKKCRIIGSSRISQSRGIDPHSIHFYGVQ